MTSNEQQATTLVLGGTGKTGRRVAQRLELLGVPVRLGSRSGVPPFDWEDRSTWPAVLDGVGAMYVAYHPDLAVPGAAQTVDALAREAVASGVRRIVLLSGRGEEEAQRTERLVQACGAEVTVVRCSWFSQNFSDGPFRELVLAGDVALPVDGIAEPFVDVEDIADVAVAALTKDGHAGRVYELTGPRLLTFGAAVDEIARATGRDLRLVPVGIDEWVDALAELGEPPETLALLRYLFEEVLDGRNAHLADGVREAVGRPARDFAEYARREAAAGAWEPGR